MFKAKVGEARQPRLRCFMTGQHRQKLDKGDVANSISPIREDPKFYNMMSSGRHSTRNRMIVIRGDKGDMPRMS